MTAHLAAEPLVPLPQTWQIRLAQNVLSKLRVGYTAHSLRIRPGANRLTQDRNWIGGRRACCWRKLWCRAAGQFVGRLR